MQEDYLCHYGVQGMKWGRRKQRYQKKKDKFDRKQSKYSLKAAKANKQISKMDYRLSKGKNINTSKYAKTKTKLAKYMQKKYSSEIKSRKYQKKIKKAQAMINKYLNDAA